MNELYAVLYPILWFFMWIFHPWKAVGRENLPEGGALLCGNHTTLGDPVYVVCAVMQLLVFSHYGFIGVKRGKADVGAVKACLKALKNGEKLLLFPEGTRVREGESSEAHTGAAMFATRSGCSIVPVYISPRKRWFRRTTVIFGQPYYPEFAGRRATPEDYQRIADELMVKIRALGEETP